jgi:hypothetical protein
MALVVEVAKDEDQVLQLEKEERETKMDSSQRYMNRAFFVSPIKTP